MSERRYQQPLRHTHQHPFFPHTSGSFSQAQDSPSSLIMAWPPIHSAAFSGRVKLHPKFGVTAYPRCFSFNSNEPNKFIIEQLYNPLSHSLVTVDLSSSESAIETQTSSELGIVSELRCTNHDVFLKSSFSLSFWDFFFFYILLVATLFIQKKLHSFLTPLYFWIEVDLRSPPHTPCNNDPGDDNGNCN